PQQDQQRNAEDEPAEYPPFEMRENLDQEREGIAVDDQRVEERRRHVGDVPLEQGYLDDAIEKRERQRRRNDRPAYENEEDAVDEQPRQRGEREMIELVFDQPIASKRRRMQHRNDGKPQHFLPTAP